MTRTRWLILGGIGIIIVIAPVVYLYNATEEPSGFLETEEDVRAYLLQTGQCGDIDDVVIKPTKGRDEWSVYCRFPGARQSLWTYFTKSGRQFDLP